MDHGIMPDSDIIPYDKRAFGVGMQSCIILDIGIAPDLDLGTIASDYGSIPYARSVSDLHVTDVCVFGNINWRESKENPRQTFHH